MNIRQLPSGMWLLDSGMVKGLRVRRYFKTEKEARDFEKKAVEIAEEWGKRLMMDWLGVPEGEIPGIVMLRREVVALGVPVDWGTPLRRNARLTEGLESGVPATDLPRTRHERNLHLPGGVGQGRLG